MAEIFDVQQAIEEESLRGEAEDKNVLQQQRNTVLVIGLFAAMLGIRAQGVLLEPKHPYAEDAEILQKTIHAKQVTIDDLKKQLLTEQKEKVALGEKVQKLEKGRVSQSFELSNVGFALNSPVLTPEGKAKLAEIAQQMLEKMEEYPDGKAEINIEGHTDRSMLPNAEKDWNDRLSYLRALAVKQSFLTYSPEFAKAKLNPIGHGATFATQIGDDPTARRTEVTLNIYKEAVGAVVK